VALARTEIVNDPGQQLFARTSLSQNQDGGVGRSDGFNLVQNSFDRLTVANDLFEIELGLELIFKVKFLLGECFVQLRNASALSSATATCPAI
jgi:hypothetical protein